MSGAVGSKPTLTVSGPPEGELGLERVRGHDVHGALGEVGEGVGRRSLSLHDHAAALDPAAALEQGAARRAGRGGARPPGCARRASPRCRWGDHGTASWATIGPESSPSSTRCTVAPLTFTPCSSAWRCASRPGKAGRSAGWMFRIRPGEGAHEDGREQAHEAGEADEVDAGAPAGSPRSRRRRPRASGRGGRGRRRGSRPCGRARGRRRPPTFETTTAISPPSSPRRAASMSACRFEPRPLTRTPTFFTGVRAPPAASLVPGDARALADGADHEARLPAPLERVLDVVEVARRDDDHHADAHVEGARTSPRPRRPRPSG